MLTQLKTSRSKVAAPKKKIVWGNPKGSRSSLTPEKGSPEGKAVNKSVDYLKALRIKRSLVDNNQKKNYGDKVLGSYINNPGLNGYQKLEIIKGRAEEVEKKAMRDEKLMRMNGGDNGLDFEKAIAVNDMYIEAITAKLRILD